MENIPIDKNENSKKIESKRKLKESRMALRELVMRLNKNGRGRRVEEGKAVGSFGESGKSGMGVKGNAMGSLRSRRRSRDEKCLRRVAVRRNALLTFERGGRWGVEFGENKKVREETNRECGCG